MKSLFLHSKIRTMASFSLIRSMAWSDIYFSLFTLTECPQSPPADGFLLSYNNCSLHLFITMALQIQVVFCFLSICPSVCLQLHLIHWNSTLFNTLEDALGKKNGVLVIALFVQVNIHIKNTKAAIVARPSKCND